MENIHWTVAQSEAFHEGDVVIKRGRNLLIMGDYGVGKSTLLRNMYTASKQIKNAQVRWIAGQQMSMATHGRASLGDFVRLAASRRILFVDDIDTCSILAQHGLCLALSRSGVQLAASCTWPSRVLPGLLARIITVNVRASHDSEKQSWIQALGASKGLDPTTNKTSLRVKGLTLQECVTSLRLEVILHGRSNANLSSTLLTSGRPNSDMLKSCLNTCVKGCIFEGFKQLCHLYRIEGYAVLEILQAIVVLLQGPSCPVVATLRDKVVECTLRGARTASKFNARGGDFMALLFYANNVAQAAL